MNKGKPMDKYLCCPYNVAVECDGPDMDKDCSRCGWSPVEEIRRREVLRKLAKHNCLRREAKRHV